MILALGRIWLPGYAKVPQDKIQGAVTTSAATLVIGLPTGKHDGSDDDASPNGTAVYGATDDGPVRKDAGSPAHTDADDVITVDNDTDDATATHDATPAATWLMQQMQHAGQKLQQYAEF